MTVYRIKDYRTYKVDDDEQLIPLANFEAHITKETRTIDGMTSSTILTISGQQSNGVDGSGVPKPPRKLKDVDIDASEFPGFAWVLRAWGSGAVIYPGSGVKDDLRAAIQLSSKPEVKEVFGTMGWQADIKGNAIYLHAGGAIKEDGNDARVTVSLPPELRRFNLSSGEPGCEPEEAFKTSLDLIKLGPPDVMWCLWAATYTPIMGPVDFAIHVTGRSGTYKSEIASLFQSHYGSQMDARHLPASWSSTANALEAEAFFAANAILVVDDFVPVGTSYQQKAYQTNADRLVRGQGNQAGRARLSDAASFKSAYYPRGLIFSTGEDTPDGHSVRARMLIMELSPGDCNTTQLTASQQKRTQLPVALSAFIQDACDTVAPDMSATGQVLKPELVQRIQEVRDQLLSIGHSRTPPMLARLMATVETVLSWAAERGFITSDQANELTTTGINAIMEVGNKQASYLETADPVSILLNAIRQSLAGMKANLRSMSGGVPTKPELVGWTATSMTGEQTKYKANGPTIGWIDWDDDVIYLEADQAYAAAKKEAGNDLAITKQTAWKRLKDAGLLVRTDTSRSRNTVRIQADGHARNVLALCASDFFDSKEVHADGNEEQPEDGDGNNDPNAIITGIKADE